MWSDLELRRRFTEFLSVKDTLGQDVADARKIAMREALDNLGLQRAADGNWEQRKHLINWLDAYEYGVKLGLKK